MGSSWQERSRLLVGFTTLFIIGADLFVVSPLLPLIAEEYAVSSSSAGWMVTVFAITYVVCAPWLGGLSDRIGRRVLIAVGLSCFAAANLLTGLAPSFFWLLASRIFAGLSAAAVTPSIYAVVGDVAPEDKRGTWLAIVGSGLLMALWSAVPMGTLAAQWTGWSTVFFILAAVGVLLGAVNGGAWPKTSSSSEDQSKEELKNRLKKLVGLLRAVSVTVLWGTAVYGFYTYLGTGLRSESGFSSNQIAAILVIYGVGAVVGSLYGGRLADRLGAKRVSTTSLASMSLVIILVGLTLSIEYAAFVLLGVFALLAYAYFPSYQSRLAQNFPDRLGEFLAGNNSALYVGIALGSAIGSAVIARLDFAVLLYICGGIGLVGALSSAGRTKRREGTEEG